jgi:hypothetical protein
MKYNTLFLRSVLTEAILRAAAFASFAILTIS